MGLIGSSTREEPIAATAEAGVDDDGAGADEGAGSDDGGATSVDASLDVAIDEALDAAVEDAGA